MEDIKTFKIGDNVEIVVGEDRKYFTVTGVDDTFYVDSHSALSAGGTESYAEITNLDPPAAQLYQFYLVRLVRGNVKVSLKQPAATNRWGTNKSPDGGFLTDEFDEMALTNFFVMEDYPPNVQLVNSTDVEITAVIRWFGLRYALKKIPVEVQGGELTLSGKKITVTPVTIGGLSQ